MRCMGFFFFRLPEGAIRDSTTLLAMLKVSEIMTETACSEQALQALGTFIESWMLDVCLRDAETTSNSHERLLSLFCSLAGGLPVQVEHRTTGGIVSGDMEKWRDQVGVPCSEGVSHDVLGKFNQSRCENGRLDMCVGVVRASWRSRAALPFSSRKSSHCLGRVASIWRCSESCLSALTASRSREL